VAPARRELNPRWTRVCRIVRNTCILAAAELVIVSASLPHGRSERVNLFPKLRAGQTVSYYVSYHAEKIVTTESAVVSSAPADNAATEVHALLRFEVLDLQTKGDRSVIHARTYFDALNSDLHPTIPGLKPPGSETPRERKGKTIDFAIFPDGRIEDVLGLEALSADEQQAWRGWAARFASGSVFPSAVKISQTFKSEEPENSPSAIEGLRWLRNSRYVRDEPCRPASMSVQGDLAPSDAPSETCAVILTDATLKQKSSSANTTPQAFQVRELRTAGKAGGTNRIISYISLKTGLLVRSTEEANQSMDVTVAKTDGSNRVRYTVKAKSRCEILLVTETAQTSPNSALH
jgi:hypothetical protein